MHNGRVGKPVLTPAGVFTTAAAASRHHGISTWKGTRWARRRLYGWSYYPTEAGPLPDMPAEAVQAIARIEAERRIAALRDLEALAQCWKQEAA